MFDDYDKISQNLGLDKETMKHGLQKFMEEKGKSEADLVEGFTSCTGSLVTSGAWSRPDCAVPGTDSKPDVAVDGDGCADGSCGLDGSGTSGGDWSVKDGLTDNYLRTWGDYERALEATKNGGKPLAVLYTGTWSPNCEELLPIYRDMASEFPDLVLRVVDFYENTKTFRKAYVRYLPTLKIFKDGVETVSEASDGGLTEARLREILKEASESGSSSDGSTTA